MSDPVQYRWRDVVRERWGERWLISLWMTFMCSWTLLGCSTLRVHEENAAGKHESRPGVPFFIKSEEYAQTTTYKHTAYEVALIFESLTVEGKKAPSRELGRVLLSAPVYGGAEMADLRQAVRETVALGVEGRLDLAKTLEPVEAAFLALEQAAHAAPVSIGTPASDAMSIIGNKIASRTVVDRSRKYYINARAPVFGTGSADFTLAADGTLTNVKGEFEEKVLDQLPGLLPVKEFLSKELELDPDETSEAEMESFLMSSGFEADTANRLYQAGAPVHFRVVLSSEPQVALYELATSYGPERPIEVGAPLRPGCIQVGSCELSVRHPSAVPKTEAPKNAYTIQGSIALPDTQKE